MRVELRTLMANDTASGGIFNQRDAAGDADAFNVDADFYPQSAVGSKVSDVPIIFVRANLEGDNQAPGDGTQLNRGGQRGARQSVQVHVPLPTTITLQDDPQSDEKPDIWKIGGVFYTVKRQLSRDDYMIKLLCVRKANWNVQNQRNVG